MMGFEPGPQVERPDEEWKVQTNPLSHGAL